MEIDIPTFDSRPLNLVFKIPISKLKKFWDGLEEGKVYATKCIKCGKLIFPPVADCPNCLCSDMDWVEIKGEGEIETFTHIIVRPASFQQEKPYTVVIVRMNEGIKILSWLTEARISEIHVGMKVKLVVKPHPKGNITYMFVPV